MPSLQPYIKRFLLYILLVGLISALHSSGSFAQQARQTDKQLLRNVMNDIGKTYEVRFAYKSSLIKDTKIVYPENIGKVPLPQLLNEILSPLGMSYKHTGGKYYTIVRAALPIENQDIKGQIHPLRKHGHVHGQVSNMEKNLPIAYATVRIDALGLQTQTDALGKYQFKDIPTGKYKLVAQSLGYRSVEQWIDVDSTRQVYEIRIPMQEESLDLAEVQVVATEGQKDGEATTSLITKQAIEHLQATSLADVMQLLPGKLANNPQLTSVNRVSLRQVNTDNVGSLGTALIINGAPVSNNANMQFNHSASGGVNASYATTAGAGMDFRQIPADNIESVEVIRGIPSVEYGDLTSGAIIVQTKSGKEPLQIKTRINPTLAQFWLGQGFALGKDGGTLNIDADYTNAVSDQRYSVQSFNRYTSNILYKKTFRGSMPLNTSTGFSYGANIGQRKQDPDDHLETTNRSSDYYYRFRTSGKWETQKRFARMVDYTVSIDYAIQKSYQQAMTSGGFPIVYSMQDTMVAATLVNGTYLSQLWVDGKPLNAYAKLGNRFFARTGSLRHQVLMGIEWRSDGNFGQGKSYDYSRPPRLESGVGTRPRSYSDIPTFHQLSAYLQDHIDTHIWNRGLSIQAGLRYDNIQPSGVLSSDFAQVLSPRVNVSYRLLPQLSLRGGYGLAAKAPTLAYLYPQNAYFDQISLNHTPDNANERLILVSTYVFPTNNSELKMAVNRKKELGFVWQQGQRQFNITAYHEHTSNAYEYQSILDSYQRIDVPQYSVSERPEGQLPVVSTEPTSTNTYFVDYNIPTNGRDQVNKGIEFDLDFGRIEAIRTAFVLNGAWMSSRSTMSSYYVLKKSVVSNQQRERVGIYPSGRGTLSERFNTTMRIIHHIPEFRMVATLVAQTVWRDRNRYLGYEKNALGYLSLSTGALTWLSTAERASLDAVTDEDIVQNIADEYYLTESWKPLWLFNLKLTKEIGQRMGFSFFANNVFMNRPLEASTRWVNQYTRRNQALFFGMELSMKLF